MTERAIKTKVHTYVSYAISYQKRYNKNAYIILRHVIYELRVIKSEIIIDRKLDQLTIYTLGNLHLKKKITMFLVEFCII